LKKAEVITLYKNLVVAHRKVIDCCITLNDSYIYHPESYITGFLTQENLTDLVEINEWQIKKSKEILVYCHKELVKLGVNEF